MELIKNKIGWVTLISLEVTQIEKLKFCQKSVDRIKNLHPHIHFVTNWYEKPQIIFLI